jgi:hypothetical protein
MSVCMAALSMITRGAIDAETTAGTAITREALLEQALL